MLAGPRQRRIEAEVRTVNLCRFLHMALLEQERTERVARRLHPAPGLVIGEIVVEGDRAAQMGEGLVIGALAVGDLASHHLARDGHDVLAVVIHELARIGNARGFEFELLRLGLC